MSENCICEDRDVLEYEEVNRLNQLEGLKKRRRGEYRVVRLYVEVKP